MTTEATEYLMKKIERSCSRVFKQIDPSKELDTENVSSFLFDEIETVKRQFLKKFPDLTAKQRERIARNSVKRVFNKALDSLLSEIKF